MANEHADKRSVSTDALETLGTIIGPNEGRDAIHLAVDPQIAVTKLYPSQDVGLVEGGAGPCENPIGIVDPFLTNPVQPGEWFWLVIYPRKITSLRHVWTHPAFEEGVKPLNVKEQSEQWLREFIGGVTDMSYEKVLAFIEDDIGNEWVTVKGSDAHGTIPPEFWTHYENVTGKRVDPNLRPEWFSCSC